MANISEFVHEIVQISSDGTALPIDYDFKVVTIGGVANLMCVACKEGTGTPIYWCQHLAEVTSVGADAKMIWGPEPGESVLSETTWQLSVPIFPTTNVFTRVTLVGGEVEIGKRYAVWWNDEQQSTLGAVQFVCFISPGEGRNAIRTTLIELMLSHLPEIPTCAAGHHSVSAQAQWSRLVTQSISKPVVMYPTYWSIFTTGWCKYCVMHNPANDPDLIPTGSGTGFPGGAR